MPGYRTIAVDQVTYDRIRQAADRDGRTIGKQVSTTMEALEAGGEYRVIHVSELPRPKGAASVPLVLVPQDEQA